MNASFNVGPASDPIPRRRALRQVLCLASASLLTGCRRGRSANAAHSSGVIQNSGSDTIVNLAQVWAEEYAAVDPSVSVEVSGGGSGTGIAALINGTVDIANSSRKIEPGERDEALRRTGKEPREFVVGYDALAVFVHKDNPLEEITIEQLAGIYGEHGGITHWAALGVSNHLCKRDKIIRVSRQSNSGTYHCFREAIVGKKGDFKLGSLDLHGSKDVVELIGRTPCAIGYSGMGYANTRVKMLRVAPGKALKAVAPTPAATLDGSYPIARPLYMYTAGEPAPHIQKYMDWVQGETGQRIVTQCGYVPKRVTSAPVGPEA